MPPSHLLEEGGQRHCRDLEMGRRKAFVLYLRSAYGHTEGSGPTATLAPVCPGGQEGELLHVGEKGWVRLHWVLLALRLGSGAS